VSGSFASGKRANGICDVCGFEFKLNDLKKLSRNRATINIKVCKECWEPENPQSFLGELPVYDPQALREPRPDNSDSTQSRVPSGPSPRPQRAFYSFSDILNSNVIDSAELVSTETLGNLEQFPADSGNPTDFNSSGVLLLSNGTKSLAWPSSFLVSNSLHNTGFTMHYEIECAAFTTTTTGSASAGDTLGLLFHETVAKQLGFFRLQSVTNWSDRGGVNPVVANNIRQANTALSTTTSSVTHVDYDFSVTKLAVGYRMDVYISRTLWYTSTNTSLSDFSNVSLLLAGGGDNSNPQARIRKAMLIKGPVNPNAGILAIHCALLGDSNGAIMTYQGPDTASDNNPLVVEPTAGAKVNLNSSGYVWLNSELHRSGVSAQYKGVNQLSNFAIPGWRITEGEGAFKTTTLETEITTALQSDPQPTYWFSEMGGNDVVGFNIGINGGYTNLSDWVTYVVDTYITQINRVLSASVNNKFFVASTPRYYTATNYEDASTYTEQLTDINVAFIAELEKRIPNHCAGRVFYVNQYQTWSPNYHASPNIGTGNYFYGIHFNYDGYRKQAENFGSILPNLRA
jgi:hypothetical protein